MFSNTSASATCRVVVAWIDWYPYHVARFVGLESAPALAGHVVGLEMVGGIGVHAGLKFREQLPEGLPVQTLMPESSWASVNKGKLAAKLWRRLTRLNPEAVLVPGYYTLPGLACALWARAHGRRSVLMTESTAFDHQRTGWKEALKGALLRALFDWAVCGGKAHVAYLRQLGFPADRIAGFYDVVDNAKIAAGVAALRSARAPGEAASQTEPPYFLYVGRHSEEKNLAALLSAWLQYRAEGGSWPLVLVGNGPEHAALQAQAAQSPFAAEVHFPGMKNFAELLPFYAHAGCFVLPSSREPWGLVVNEAMAAGLPVLVSDRCGCAADLVEDGANGFTFAPSDLGAIADGLRAIEQLTPATRARFGERSAERIAAYAPAAFGASVARMLDARREPSRQDSGAGSRFEPAPDALHERVGQGGLR